MTIRESKWQKFFRATVISVCAVALMTALFCFAGCGAGGDKGHGGAGAGNPPITYTDIKGIVRDVAFRPAAVDVLYDGERVTASAADGSFTARVPQGDETAYTAKFAAGNHSIALVDYGADGAHIQIVVCAEEIVLSDFYYLSGKVVLHSDGESVASGSCLKVDGTTVCLFDTDRNYTVGPIHKDSVVSVENADGEFITASELPYDHDVFGDRLLSADDIMQKTVNGQSFTFPHLTGVTFRFRPRA